MKQDSVAQSWGEWLTRYEWDHYATLTFTYEPTVDQARRDFTRFRRRLEQRAQRAVQWFSAIETGQFGRRHMHALLQGTQGLAAEEVEAPWRSGIARVEPYDAKRGATYYVSKTIGRAATEHDISECLELRDAAAVGSRI